MKLMMLIMMLLMMMRSEEKKQGRRTLYTKNLTTTTEGWGKNTTRTKVVPHRNVSSQTSSFVMRFEAHNPFGLCNVVVPVWLCKWLCAQHLQQPAGLSAYVTDGLAD